MRGRGTVTAVEARKPIPEPGTAAARIQRFVVKEGLILSGSGSRPRRSPWGHSEVAAAEKMLEHARARGLVQRDAVASGQDEGRAGAHRDLEPALVLDAALLQRRHRLAKFLAPIDLNAPAPVGGAGKGAVGGPAGGPDMAHP